MLMARSRHRLPSAQTIVGLVTILVTGLFVLYPIYFLLQAAFDVGDQDARPPTAYGLGNFAALPKYSEIMLNTLGVSLGATAMALAFGFLTAWILNRTNVPFRRTLEQAMAVPYYVTPLLGAFAWSLLGAPESGFINQLWRALGGHGAILDIMSPFGIAWVMALFEGSVAFVMIGAVMKSMDPSLEEASQVIGGGRLRTMLRITLPLVAPGVLGAAIFVFAEMLGSFSAALVLGTPNRFYVITTAIYLLVSQYPPRIPLAAAMGVSLFAVMFLMLFLYRRLISRRSYVTVSGKAFRPRQTDMGGLRWALFGVCVGYVILSVVLPILTLIYASVQKLAVAFPAAGNFTLDNYRTALTQNAVRYAMSNSLVLGVLTATIGVALTGMLSWLIHRTRLPGRGVLEYVAMLPQAVPRLVFAFGMMWAWLVIPIPVYGTIWLLLIAYLTVFLPLGLRTISSVLLQLDRSLDECGQVCGAGWGYRVRTITMPLLRPGMLAAWMLLFIASVRELGASILLMGPNSQVLTPAIVDAWFSSSSELTAAMALIQTIVVGLAVAFFMLVTRRAARQGG
ncbi:MAG: iron ABC transporter permease [Rhodospirillales bacterium]|nr:iron ABC transporter permease [Rhodospirillales bacterium]MDE2197373.1 iron ABC transporter permease [Rhodospirillales bacterium]MDE2576843.1 iron ABC transporter permease [Rhodospirillales bacterium]